MSETRRLSGGPAVPSATLVQTDGVTITGDGSHGDPLVATSTAAAVRIEDEGIPLAGAPHTTINFVGAGVTAADAGGHVARVTIPGGSAGVDLEDEGTPVAGNPHATLNFVGAGVTVTNVGGVGTVSVPGGITIQNASAPISGNPHSTLSFAGGVDATDAGSGRATITVGVALEDEGIPVAGSLHSTLNFVGAGVTVTDVGGVGTISVPGAGAGFGNTFQGTATVADLILGQAVFSEGGGSSFALGPAQNDPEIGLDTRKAQVLGLVTVPGLEGDTVTVTFVGLVTLTVAQWTAITGEVGGLTPQTAYFLDSSARPGKLTLTKPTTGFVAQVGVALSTTSMLLSTPCFPTPVP